jgi:phenylacetate-CoA ligase
MALAETIYRGVPVWAQQVFLNAYAFQRERHRYGARGHQAVARILDRERWSLEQIGEFQDRQIRAVVTAAYAGSRYYREVMDGLGLRPSDIRGVHDLPRLPLLTRDVVRNRPPDLMTAARPRRGWIHGHTSGTTGSPLGIWYDRQTCVENMAQDTRQKLWAGKRPEDWIGVFLGRVIVPPGQRRPPYWRVNLVQRQVWFSSFHMSEAALERYLAEIRRRGLRFLEGYPSTLFVLARYLERRGETLPMTAVFTSSETLHAVQREAIERAFACPIFDFYGLAERVIFAAECEAHGGRHVAEDYGFTEVVDEEGHSVPDGEWGFLVGTSLHNVAMPMLRYRTKDVSRIVTAPCLCGRPARRIDAVTTKAEDIVVTPDGRLISPSILTHPFKPFDQIVKSQIVQDAPDRIVVRIVPSAQFTEEHQRTLIEGLRLRLGEEVQVTISIEDDIPPERSGKFRWVVSRVDSAYAVPWARSTELMT